jgi:hypothetical protein
MAGSPSLEQTPFQGCNISVFIGKVGLKSSYLSLSTCLSIRKLPNHILILIA